MARKINYVDGADCPELIEFCQKCQKADCDGLCEEYANKYREIFGLPQRIRKGPTRQPEAAHHTCYVRRVYEAFGETHTLTDWAKITGLSYQTIWWRIDHGMDIEQALSMPAHSIEEKLFSYGGRVMSRTEWCRELNIPRSRFYDNLARGMTVGQALGLEG